MKKTKRILCLFFAILMVLSILPLSVFAGVENPMHSTYVCNDLRNMGYDLSKYPYDSSADFVTVIDFLEYGYDYNGDQRYYGLYIYLYNPSGKVLQENGNYVELSYIKKDNTSSGYAKYALQILSKSSDTANENVFYKLYLPMSRNIANYIINGIRTYYVSSIELQYSSETGAKAKSFVVGGTYKYQGYQKHFGRTDDEDTLYCTFEKLEVIETKLNAASWFSNTSDLGEDYRYELSSVYFNIPNYFIEKYGNPKYETSGLYSVQGEYYKYLTNGILTTDESYYNGFLPSIGKFIKYGGEFIGPGFYDLDVSQTIMGTRTATYNFMCNMYTGSHSDGYYAYSINSLYNLTDLCTIVKSDSSEKAYASQTSFLNAYNFCGRNHY
ncbi:MAG: hypothetical protein IJZ25_00760, partial [Lachnospiraceae bacterium]|nr:hypothetical protein [Lachnospiraceae bacterium]